MQYTQSKQTTQTVNNMAALLAREVATALGPVVRSRPDGLQRCGCAFSNGCGLCIPGEGDPEGAASLSGRSATIGGFEVGLIDETNGVFRLPQI